jgi:hypothetical protein
MERHRQKVERHVQRMERHLLRESRQQERARKTPKNKHRWRNKRSCKVIT